MAKKDFATQQTQTSQRNTKKKNNNEYSFFVFCVHIYICTCMIPRNVGLSIRVNRPLSSAIFYSALIFKTMIQFPHLKTYFNIYKKRLEEAITNCWVNNNIYIYLYILITKNKQETSEHKLFESGPGEASDWHFLTWLSRGGGGVLDESRGSN